MKVLLLGGTGFIGQNIQAQRPNWQWTNIGSHEVDLTDRLATDAINGDYDIIINSAGFFGGIVFNQRYQQEILYTNLAISANICRLVDRIKPKKFISIGSACLYPQDAINRVSESMIGPDNYHPSVKYSAMSKHWLLKMMQNMSTEWEFLILSNVYGPGEHVDYERSHFVGSLINKIKQSTCNIDMLGTGVAVRDFIYISDVAEIICKYCELNYATCTPTNISTGTGTDILTMTETLTTIANPQLNVQWGHAKDNGVLYKVLDNSKMIKDIEFTPQMKLNVGLKNTWNWFTNL